MRMKAAVARAPSAPLSLETLELEDPRPGEIRVRIHASGVCHTDIAMRDQVFPVPQPVVLGHEGAGVVDAVGVGMTSFAVGDHVVMSFNSCGECTPCREGAASYCQKAWPLNFGSTRLDGTTALRRGEEKIHGNFFGQSSFAEYAICNTQNAVRVSKDLPLELLAPLGCGLMTGAGAVWNVLRPRPGQSIVVFGTGAVGLAAILAARVAGAGTIVAVDVLDSRLQVAKELGATHAVNGKSANVVEAVRAIRSGGVNFAIDTTANPAVIQNAVACVGLRGVCAVLGASRPDQCLSLNLIDAISSGKTVRGIVEGDAAPSSFIPMMIDLYQQGRFPFDKLIRYYPFEEINQAIHDSETSKVIKAVLRMDGH